MVANDWIELARAFGPQAAILLFVLWILAKNGLLRVILRDDGHSGELDSIRAQVDNLNIRVAVLEDRWQRGGK